MSKIEWTDKTWNPIIGCAKKSEGCKNCYAEIMANRLAGIKATEDYYCEVVSFKMDDFGKWNGKTHFVESALENPLKRKKPTKYFVCSMGDLFHESVPFEWIDRVMDVISQCPQHTFQILTKRPERMYKYFQHNSSNAGKLWVGVTVENQEMANKRIPILTDIPLNKRFISIEPMLSEIILPQESVLLDWVICGGETGSNARPIKIDWVEKIKEYCSFYNIPFFFKSWGTCKEFKGLKKTNEHHLIDGVEYKEFPK